MTITSNAIWGFLIKPKIRPKLLPATVIILAAVLCILVVLPPNLPRIITFPITARYPKCDHIVLVSERRHGSTWFISNAEGCLSVNGSFVDLLPRVEIWNHGKVKNISLEDAVDLVRFKTSVKLFPPALYEHGEDLRAFLEIMRDLQVPVFVLRRNLETAYASLQAARKNDVWSNDNGGTVVNREFNTGRWFTVYKNGTETYFKDMKKLMNNIGITWDEVQYETILSQRLILGKRTKCYVQNCNFKN